MWIEYGKQSFNFSTFFTPFFESASQKDQNKTEKSTDTFKRNKNLGSINYVVGLIYHENIVLAAYQAKVDIVVICFCWKL